MTGSRGGFQLQTGFHQDDMAVVRNGRNVLPMLQVDELHPGAIPVPDNHALNLGVVPVPMMARYATLSTSGMQAGGLDPLH